MEFAKEKNTDFFIHLTSLNWFLFTKIMFNSKTGLHLFLFELLFVEISVDIRPDFQQILDLLQVVCCSAQMLRSVLQYKTFLNILLQTFL